jgi:hypothetical protein
MTPTLIVLALLALGVGIVAFATHRPPGSPASIHSGQDIAWSDPMASATAPASESHPFAHAPDPTPVDTADAVPVATPAEAPR